MMINSISRFCRAGSGPVACLVFAAIFIFCGGDDKVETAVADERVAIIVIDQSYIRLDPVLYSSVVAYTKIGEKVAILGQSSEKTWVGNTADYWYKIRIPGGLAGWTFGSNLKIFSEKESDDIDDFLREFWRGEKGRILGKLIGRWWSIDRNDAFTNQCIDIYDDGSYKAYTTGGKPIAGEYTINYREHVIKFSKGTPFGKSVKYVSRGDSYILEYTGKDELKFKRIKRKFDEKDKEEKPAVKDAGQNSD